MFLVGVDILVPDSFSSLPLSFAAVSALEWVYRDCDSGGKWVRVPSGYLLHSTVAV